MASWRLAASLDTLRSQLNATWPNRDRSSDGTIGDASHAAGPSDHNPNAAGVVCAYDIDTDLDGTNDSNDPQMAALVEGFRTHPHPDLKYVIYAGRIFSSYASHGLPPLTWRNYTGADPHTTHAHVSVGVGPDGQSQPPYDDLYQWYIATNQPPPAGDDDMTTDQYNALMQELREGRAQIASLLSNISNQLNDVNGADSILERIAKKIGA